MNNITFKKLTDKEISINYEDNTYDIIKEFLIQRYRKIIDLVNCYHLAIKVMKDFPLFESDSESDYLIEFCYVLEELSDYSFFEKLDNQHYIYYSIEETKPTIDYALREFKINNLLND
jgi:hypothetical protein